MLMQEKSGRLSTNLTSISSCFDSWSVCISVRLTLNFTTVENTAKYSRTIKSVNIQCFDGRYCNIFSNRKCIALFGNRRRKLVTFGMPMLSRKTI